VIRVNTHLPEYDPAQNGVKHGRSEEAIHSGQTNAPAPDILRWQNYINAHEMPWRRQHPDPINEFSEKLAYYFCRLVLNRDAVKRLRFRNPLGHRHTHDPNK
jgi:hypothetical protein